MDFRQIFTSRDCMRSRRADLSSSYRTTPTGIYWVPEWMEKCPSNPGMDYAMRSRWAQRDNPVNLSKLTSLMVLFMSVMRRHVGRSRDHGTGESNFWPGYIGWCLSGVRAGPDSSSEDSVYVHEHGWILHGQFDNRRKSGELRDNSEFLFPLHRHDDSVWTCAEHGHASQSEYSA